MRRCHQQMLTGFPVCGTGHCLELWSAILIGLGLRVSAAWDGIVQTASRGGGGVLVEAASVQVVSFES